MVGKSSDKTIFKKAPDWIVDLGYKNTFLIYVGLIGFFGLFIPVAWWYGPTWRRRFPDRIADGYPDRNSIAI